jgi:hypothetical protein
VSLLGCRGIGRSLRSRFHPFLVAIFRSGCRVCVGCSRQISWPSPALLIAGSFAFPGSEVPVSTTEGFLFAARSSFGWFRPRASFSAVRARSAGGLRFSVSVLNRSRARVLVRGSCVVFLPQAAVRPERACLFHCRTNSPILISCTDWRVGIGLMFPSEAAARCFFVFLLLRSVCWSLSRQLLLLLFCVLRNCCGRSDFAAQGVLVLPTGSACRARRQRASVSCLGRRP